MTTEEVQSLLPEAPNTEVEYRELFLDRLPSDEEIGPPPPTRGLIESIKMFGIRQPIAVYYRPTVKNKPGGYEIIGGRRRVQAARAVGLQLIPAMVGNDPAGMAALDVQMNATQKPNEFAYLARVTEMYHANHDIKEIATATRLPAGTVKRLINIKTNLDPQLLGAAEEGAMRFSTAESAAKLTHDQQTRLLATLWDNGKLTGKDVHEAKRAYHASFAGVDLGLGEMPGYEETQEMEDNARAELNDARIHLAERLAEIPTQRRPSWSKADVEAVEKLLKAL